MLTKIYEWVLSKGLPSFRLFVEAKRFHEKSPYGFYAGIQYIDLTKQQMAEGQGCSLLLRAEKLYKQSIQWEAADGQLYNKGIAHYQLGLLFQWQGRTEEARKEYEDAAAIFRNSPNTDALGALSDCYFRFAEMCLYQGNYDEARSYLLKCRSLDRKSGDGRGLQLVDSLLLSIDQLYNKPD